MTTSNPNASSGFQELVALAGLRPESLPTIKVGQFLTELHLFPHRALTAPGLLAYAIEAAGRVKIAEEPLSIQPRLRMLDREGVSLYSAFRKLRGQQRMIDSWVQHLKAASHGGEVVKLATVFQGKTGTGKTMFVEAIKQLMEGQLVYHIEGCPVHENPLAILNLLEEDRVTAMLAHLKLDGVRTDGATIRELLAVLGKPCQHCHGLVMNAPDPSLALFDVNVVPMKLTTYTFGVETLTTGTSIHQLLREASRGVADFGELFAGFENEKSPVAPHARALASDLHDVLNDQRIPAILSARREGGDKEKEPLVTPKGWQPISVVAIASTNPGAFEGFKKTLGEDGGKYMRLMRVVEVLHNLSVSEEVLTYRDHMVNPLGVHFDPLALPMLAWIAQSSRYNDNASTTTLSSSKPNWIARSRMNDGEVLEISKGGTPPKLWSMKDLWEEYDTIDGTRGLNVPIMLTLLAEIMNEAVAEGHKCVSTYEMLKFVKRRFVEFRKSNGFWHDEKELVHNIAENFLVFAQKAEDKPKGIEAIYRRELKRIATVACSPDYERLLDSYFEKYALHGSAAASKDKTVFDPEQGKDVEVELKFLEEIENRAGATSSDARHEMRTSINSWIVQQRLRSGKASETTTPRRTDMPQIDRAIRVVRDVEVAKDVERLLDDETKLDEKEKAKRAAALLELTKSGYHCEHCRSRALQYIIDQKVWTFQDE